MRTFEVRCVVVVTATDAEHAERMTSRILTELEDGITVMTAYVDDVDGPSEVFPDTGT